MTETAVGFFSLLPQLLGNCLLKKTQVLKIHCSTDLLWVEHFLLTMGHLTYMTFTFYQRDVWRQLWCRLIGLFWTRLAEASPQCLISFDGASLSKMHPRTFLTHCVGLLNESVMCVCVSLCVCRCPSGSRTVHHGDVASEEPPGGAEPGRHPPRKGSRRGCAEPQLRPAAGACPRGPGAPAQRRSRRYGRGGFPGLDIYSV